MAKKERQRKGRTHKSLGIVTFYLLIATLPLRTNFNQTLHVGTRYSDTGLHVHNEVFVN